MGEGNTILTAYTLYYRHLEHYCTRPSIHTYIHTYSLLAQQSTVAKKTNANVKMNFERKSNYLTLYQTKFFRLVQIESICRRQSKCNLEREIFVGMDRKHFWKRRKCWLPAVPPFATMFSKAFSFRVVKSCDCVVKS